MREDKEMRKIVVSGCLAVVITGVGLTLAGCATGPSANVYSANQTMQSEQVRYGTVESVTGVTIEGTDTGQGVGTVAGAVLGGILGSSVGEGRGKALATVGGAVAGGVAGSAIGNQATKKNGVRIMVRLDDGRMISVVQPVDNQRFAPGQRVSVLTSPNGTTRVTQY